MANVAYELNSERLDAVLGLNCRGREGPGGLRRHRTNTGGILYLTPQLLFNVTERLVVEPASDPDVEELERRTDREGGLQRGGDVLVLRT
jgi:hypothetical protein